MQPSAKKLNNETDRLSANEAWTSLLAKILEHGKESKPRGLRIIELLNNTTQVSMIRPIVTANRRKLGFKFMAAEAWWIISGRNDVESISPFSPHIAAFSNDGYHFDGAYGPKIIDQLRYVCDTLEDDLESRQAVIEVWRPNPRTSKDIPCTLSIQWMIREEHGQLLLHCFDTMRSSDAWLGWPYDVFNFSMLSAYILLMLKKRAKLGLTQRKMEDVARLKLGRLHLTAASQHLYINPHEDGAKNIPYTMTDVQGVVEDYVRMEIENGPQAFWDRTSLETPYSPLDIDQFSSPQDFLAYLGECKAGARGQWMSELQKGRGQ
jgi:thymidylate synthase